MLGACGAAPLLVLCLALELELLRDPRASADGDLDLVGLFARGRTPVGKLLAVEKLLAALQLNVEARLHLLDLARGWQSGYATGAEACDGRGERFERLRLLLMACPSWSREVRVLSMSARVGAVLGALR